ncbi:MAG TPA: lactate racemase domain-containing protein [Gemmataceae bacterium]|jgi:nickel-dependent lactate racemase|nr:lactate racemase domain-containing protein [Gemmataceae bacterium]
MRVRIQYGREHLDVDVRDGSLVGVREQAPAGPLPDPAAAVRDALENPLGFPALRRALTPDDHVAVVVDPQLPQFAALLTAVLEHLARARVAPGAITLVCPPTATPVRLDDLPQDFHDVRVEVHDPADRKQLSYLATTRQGRRLYLNRTAVDADQLIVLARCGYDPLLGYSGAEGALYPALADEATRQEMWGRLSLEAPGHDPWPVRREAAEVAWLLGAPFMVQVIQGSDADIVHVVAGVADTSAEGHRLLDARWRKVVDRPAQTVVAGIAGAPGQQGFAALASALACAARVVQAEGRIVLLSAAQPTLGPAAELIRQAEDPERALTLLRQHTSPDIAAAFQWASSVQRASVYLLSGLPAETAEDLFTTPLDHAGQVQRLLNADGPFLFLPDADKTLAVVGE